MIEVSNLRQYHTGGDTVRLEADINFTDMDSPYPLKTIYYETKEEYADMFDYKSYNAFVLTPLFVAMFHKQDLHICGKISKRLYQNVKWYIQKIFCDYSPLLSPVNVTVDGFTEIKQTDKIIGTGISSGVDSLTTIYDKFICENDPDYKLNALFYFSHDWKNYSTLSKDHFDDSKRKASALTYFDNDNWYSEFSSEQSMFRTLFPKNQRIANELNLPCYPLETNLPVFNIVINKLKGRYIPMSYIALYSCILSLGKKISKYYIASALSYEQEKIFRNASHDKDMSEFCEMYLVPLISTEQTELILDGAPYRRVDKLKRIVDWSITRKYLNVCWHNHDDGSNCGECGKCLRTLLTLEILGKLKDYAHLFDIDSYKKAALAYKKRCVKRHNIAPFESENVDFAKENNFPMPTLKKTVKPVAKEAVKPVDKKSIKLVAKKAVKAVEKKSLEKSR